MKFIIDVKNNLSGCGTWIQVDEDSIDQIREHLSLIDITVGKPYVFEDSKEVKK